MPEFIKDGQGSGRLVGVDDDHRMKVSSRTNERVYYASRDYGKAYIVQFELTQASGGSTEGVGSIQYNGSNRLNIKQIALSTEESGMTSFGVWKNPTVTGGTLSLPINLNFSSNLSSDTTCYEATDSGSISISGGTSIFTCRMYQPKTEIIPFYDAIILGINDIIAFKGNAATTGSKIRINVMIHESIS